MRLLLLTILAASGLRAQVPVSPVFNPFPQGFSASFKTIISGDHTTAACTKGQILIDGTTFYGCTVTGSPGTFVAFAAGSGCTASGTNFLQKSDGAGGCLASSIMDNGTTVTSTEPIVAPSFSTPAGSVAGYFALGQGTATAAATGQAGFMAPASVSTPFFMKLPAAPITGFLLNTGTSDPSTITFVPVIAVANGGTNCSSPTITCFNNITGFTAAGATGTTSGNLVFSISPALTGTPTTPTPSQNDNSTKIPTTAYVDLAVANGLAGVNPAVAVLAASTANLTGTYANGASGVGATFTITATGTFSLDGVAINTIGQRVLLKDQSTGFQNGVYAATVVGAIAVSPVFTRALDYNSPSDINSTGAIPVQSGTVNTTTSWLLTSTVTTIGTDALTYVRFSSNPANLVSAVSPGAGVAHFAGGTQTATSSAVALADMATQAANTSVANVTSGSAAPTAAALPAGGTNGCSGATDIPLYTAGTGWSCTQRSTTFLAFGAVTTVNWSGSNIYGFSGEAGQSSEANLQQPVARAMTVTGFSVRLSGTIAGATSIAFSIGQCTPSSGACSGSFTSLCTIAASTNTCSVTGLSVAFAAGDFVDIRSVGTGSPGSFFGGWSSVVQ